MKDPTGIFNVKIWTFSGIVEAVLLLSTIIAGSLYIVSHLQPNLLQNFSKEWNSFVFGLLNFLLEIGPNVKKLIIGILEAPIEIYRAMTATVSK